MNSESRQIVWLIEANKGKAARWWPIFGAAHSRKSDARDELNNSIIPCGFQWQYRIRKYVRSQ